MGGVYLFKVPNTLTNHSLVFNLVVEMSGEPIIEPRLLNVTRPVQLHGDPVSASVCVDGHGKMAYLRHPREPVALHEPDKEVPAEAGPEPAQQGRKRQVEDQVERHHPYEVLNRLNKKVAQYGILGCRVPSAARAL